MPKKVYVPVVVRYDREGEMSPLSIEWEDGTVYDIDRILDKRQAASLKVGGQGWRYLCRIQGKETYLFYDLCDKKWFVEAKH